MPTDDKDENGWTIPVNTSSSFLSARVTTRRPCYLFCDPVNVSLTNAIQMQPNLMIATLVSSNWTMDFSGDRECPVLQSVPSAHLANLEAR